MIRIAYIIDTIATPAAGTENQLLRLLHGLDRSRFELHLVCLHESDWMQQADLPVPVEILEITKLASIDTWRKMKRFRRWLDGHRIDVLQSFFIDANIFACAALRSSSSPVLVSSRRNIGYWYDATRLRVLRWVNKRVDRFLANSQAAVASTVEAEKAAPDRFTVIYNGLDLEQYKVMPTDQGAALRTQWGVAAEDHLVGMVANLRPVKNIPSLIRAAAGLKDEFPHVKVAVVGEGDQRAEYEKLIDELGLTGRFLLVGRHENVLPALAAFDSAVLCSQSESFSNSLIEYMAAGLPIVASAVGVNVEAIRDGETGLLFELADNRGLENALRKLLKDQRAADQLGKTAKVEAFERFSLAKCLADHAAFYEKIVKEKTW